MVESGVALIAACLPSLRLLPTLQTLTERWSTLSFSQSLRNLLSVPSLRLGSNRFPSREDIGTDKAFHDDVAGDSSPSLQLEYKGVLGDVPTVDIEAQRESSQKQY